MIHHAAVDRLEGQRLVVLGDVMVDHYVHGAVSRVSEEAPVPILHVSEERFVPGGAANVAANAAVLGAEVVLIGAVGDDKAGQHLIELLAAAAPGVVARLARTDDRPTTLKTRYLGGQHQLLRVDREDRGPLAAAVEEVMLAGLRAALKTAAALVLSDYGKGVLSDAVLKDAFKAAKAVGVPVIVDPKRMTFADYRGASVITPNRKELRLATGLPVETDAQAQAAAAAAIAQSGAAILVTRSERGMSYFDPAGQAMHSPAEALEVFDVSGAGDTVVAALATAMAAGFDMGSAMRIANAAAGVVVGKHGTAMVTPTELAAALRRGSGTAEAPSAAVSRGQAAAQCAQWRSQGLTIGFANGCFDLIHPGHVSLIQQAAAACDRLVVGLNSDASVKRLKGEGRPLQDEAARAQVMAGLRGVSLVTLFEEDTPLELIQALSPDVIVKGADYAEEQVVGGAFVKARGGRVLLAQLAEGHSTSRIAARAVQPPAAREGG
jgi:D-beta-D-heptose 7-phosphate kinase/D-beta-D-heptose 1-phosphate adenosyltransferase